MRRDPLLGLIGIGAVLEEQLHDLEVPADRRVLERRAAAGVARVVVIDAIRQRWILSEERAHAREIALEGGHPDVYVRAARDQVFVDLVRRRHHVVRHVTPAAVVIVAVGELDRPCAVRAPRVDIGAARSSSSISGSCRVITAQWIG